MLLQNTMAQWNTCRGGANSTVFNKSAQIEVAFYYNISSNMLLCFNLYLVP